MLTIRSIALLLALASTPGLLACSPDSNSAEPKAGKKIAATGKEKAAPPQILSAHLSSNEPRPGETVSIEYETINPSEQDFEMSFLWQLNGRRLNDSGPEIEIPIEARRGDTIKVRLATKQGNRISEPTWASAMIGNSPEEWVDLRLEPEGDVAPGISLAAVSEVTDPDQDLIEYEYRWKLNGRLHPNRGAHFSTVGLQRGDTVVVEVTASDGETIGSDRTSNVVTIANSDPTIISAPPDFTADGTIDFEILAKDHDGDRRFIYSLDASPPAMKLDRVTGLLTWTPQEKDVGRHAVEVRVDDRHGGFALQRFDLNVRQVPTRRAKQTSPASNE